MAKEPKVAEAAAKTPAEAPAANSMDLVKVRALTNIDRDGKRHEEGATLSVPAEVATRLVEIGSAEMA